MRQKRGLWGPVVRDYCSGLRKCVMVAWLHSEHKGAATPHSDGEPSSNEEWVTRVLLSSLNSLLKVQDTSLSQELDHCGETMTVLETLVSVLGFGLLVLKGKLDVYCLTDLRWPLQVPKPVACVIL